MQYELGFLGAGNMAEAIVRAAINQGVVEPSQVIAADPSEGRRDLFAALGVTVVDDNAVAIAGSRHVVLAIKPQMLPTVGQQLAAVDVEQQVIISIMAGIRTDKIEQAIGRDARVVRVMPNTPMLVGCGMAGIATGAHARDGDDALAMRLFAAGGQAIRVDEAQIDAITAVSGSGPAYVFYLAEAMQEAARELGVGDHADLLVAQTILGAAYLLQQSDDSAAELRRKVTSPGGTTEAAINRMESQTVRAHLVAAMRAAHARSLELGK